MFEENNLFSEETLNPRTIRGMLSHHRPLLIEQASYSPSMPNLISTKKKLRLLNLYLLGIFPSNKILPEKFLEKIILQSEDLLIRRMFPKIASVPQRREGAIVFLKPAILGDVLLTDIQLIGSLADKLYLLNSEIRNQGGDLLCISSESRRIAD